MSAYRLDKGGRIDRARPVPFRFNGRDYSGFAGDTLASALLANGLSTVARSFKYHRRRAIAASGFDEPNAIVQLEEGAQTVPNLKATLIELYDGLSARSTNAWPNVEFDLLSVNGAFKRFLPAGFYYKTFTWPNWGFYEPWIRKAAGLGVSPQAADPDIYDKRYAECDILVIGGGPAGLFAAQTACRSGARVMLVHGQAELGGGLATNPARAGVMPEEEKWAEKTSLELSAAPRARVLTRTTAFGYYDHNLIGLIERLTDHLPLGERKGPRQRLWKVRARLVILATGAMERPLAFAGNDLPGVMLAGGGADYAARYGVAPGRRVVIATNNDSGYDSARVLMKAGVTVAGVVDARSALTGAARDIQADGLPISTNAVVTRARGGRKIQAAEIRTLDGAGRVATGEARLMECDCLLMSGGWSPAVHLFSQSGGKLRFDEETQAFVPGKSLQRQISIGAAAGEFDLAGALASAGRQCAAALSDLGFRASAPDLPRLVARERTPVRPVWRLRGEGVDASGANTWIDFQNDVTAADVELAARENYQSVEHVKRYTTLGMGTDQGKTSNVNGIGVLAAARGVSAPQVGVTTFRPPFEPVSIGAFAGRRTGNRFSPLRRLVAHDRHEGLNARMDEYGGWLRPAFYPRPGEDEAAAVKREVKAVRGGVGVFDASSLGKIEVFGPDAAAFLDRVYVNTMATLPPGRCRYGVMLDDNGVVFDDGVLARFAEDHFLVGATSAHATAVAEMLQEWLQCEWPDLDVVTQDVSTAWCVVNVAGPQARAVLSKLGLDIDLSADAFSHMRVRNAMLGEVPCRLQRVSFTGELSYELAAPSGFGDSLFEAIMTAGQEFSITPFGIEALSVMRMEKGFLHVGTDTDGMTLPQDIGFARALEKKKSDFIGRRSAMRPDGVRADRRQLVGLKAMDESRALPVGGHVVNAADAPPVRSQGWVTSSAWSPTVGAPVALGLVERGRARIGEEVDILDLTGVRRAVLTAPCFYDPKGERMHG